ncbi:MAG: recombinase family protein [Lachnospiraceae bacterium]|nr:recombinase family protein [Lachnospiraceae bacterium]
MYLRLSRDDSDVGNVMDRNGTIKLESNSIGNQRELIQDYIQQQQDMELYDVYIDDGFSGSNFDRPEFKRMINDIKARKVNCVIVKDLSRFGRDYIEAGKYIQKIFPALSVRFIALTDCYDSFSADMQESNFILPMKNFINDSYCRDISIKVKSQFEVKRKNGECIAPFTAYGYKKDDMNKHHLVVDAYAAENVKKIFEWKQEGMAISAIAKKLNNLGILSPKEYKKLKGNYRGGFSGSGTSAWSSTTVKRILTNEIYMGHLVQGKTEKINYKIKKTVEKPKAEWIKVENTHERIISADTFYIVQNLLKSDSRISPKMDKYSFFTGILFCGDCREQMIRRINRYKDKEKVYYICSTKNRREGCSRHSVEEKQLKYLVMEVVRRYVNTFLDEMTLFETAKKIKAKKNPLDYYSKEIEILKQEKNKYNMLCQSLHKDLTEGVITKEEFIRLNEEFKRKADELENAWKRQESMIKEMFQKDIIYLEKLKSIQDVLEFKEIDRYMLSSLIKKIYVYEEKRIEIVFYFSDKCRTKL